jgi:capsular exopolysaccharide synthesis family protein
MTNKKNGSKAARAASASESYQSLRINLIHALDSGNECAENAENTGKPVSGSAVVVTGANPSEGKSTVCVNLAVTFASAGSRILLLDADLRKPSVHRMLGLKNKNGLSSLLGGFCELDEAISRHVRRHSGADVNFDVIAGGAVVANPADLIASAKMDRLLTELKQRYAFIFVDTPPVNVVPDALLMNRFVEGIAFVVMEDKTTHPDLHAALRAAELSGANILGFIKTGAV